MKSREKTKEAYAKLCERIPGGVNSPVRACKEVMQMPLVAARAVGDLLIDLDGHEYIDYCGSWGALIHGHAFPSVVAAAQQSIAHGSSFGVTTQGEGELARVIMEQMPALERIRFVSSGTEATMSAVRLARGATDRNLLIKFSGNYHGHADFFLVQAGSGVLSCPHASSSGIPSEIVTNTWSLPYNDVEAFRQVLSQEGVQKRLAAVIVEPIAGNIGVVPGNIEFLRALREETSRVGALLIFDEVISGFRVGLGGAQGAYGIVPDLTCLGKVIGGGFPVAAFGGKREVMEHLAPIGSVYQAGTLSGNPVAMAAGLQTLHLLRAPGFYEELERKTNLLIHPVKEFLKKRHIDACIQQRGSMFTLFIGKREVNHLEDAKQLNRERYAELFRFLFDNGVYIPPSQHEAWFISMAHTDAHIEYTTALLLEFFR